MSRWRVASMQFIVRRDGEVRAMGLEMFPKDRLAWFSFRRTRGLPERPIWLCVRLLAMLVLVAAIVLTWYVHWGWRHWYTNHTPGTMNDDGGIAIATDHTTYLGDEPLAITVTNHLQEPIYTQITPHNPAAFVGIPCSIDLYAEVLDHTGHWVGAHNSALGVGAGCDLPCRGIPPETPPPQVLAIAPGASYTQHWHPSTYSPTNPPGTYRIVFRFSTDPAAAKLTRVGSVDMPRADVPGALELATTNSAPVRVVDDGLHQASARCTAV